jgi:hypothetical protein
MHNLLLDAHWPSEVILDDQVRADHLRSFPLVLCSDVRCLTDEQAEAVRAYVRDGGTLVVTGHTGALDEIGRVRAEPALDGLLGVLVRERTSYAQIVAPDDAWSDDLWPTLRLSPEETAAPEVESDLPLPWEWAEDVEVLAWGVHCADDPRREPAREHPAITAREVGEGRVLAIDRDIGGLYSHEPRAEWRRLIVACLRQFVTPPIEIDAAPHVAVTLWRQERGLVAHVLSRPHNLRVVRHQGRVDLNDVPPAGTVSIKVPGRASAERPVSGGAVELTHGEGRTTVRLPFVAQHDVVVIEQE